MRGGECFLTVRQMRAKGIVCNFSNVIRASDARIEPDARAQLSIGPDPPWPGSPSAALRVTAL